VKICVVKSRYRSAFADPLRLKSGEEVAIGERKTEWSGWLWCEDKNGGTGWVPESYLQRRGNTGILLCDYDATELTVEEGEELHIIDDESGWIRCRNQKGEVGLVPIENVSISQADD
jgi:SH3-like domain-containing protein